MTSEIKPLALVTVTENLPQLGLVRGRVYPLRSIRLEGVAFHAG